MIIHGFQKLTLLDFPGRTACTVFTAGCNLRCPFCHNASLALNTNTDIVPEDEIFGYLKKRIGILDGVAITGGEPLMNGDISDFIYKCREMGYMIKLDTNGFFPKRLKALLENKIVDYVAMDVKNTVEKYGATVGIPGISVKNVLESIEIIKSSGADYEFRTTATAEFHTPEDFIEIGRMISGAKAYYIQKFKDSGNLIEQGLHPLGDDDMKKAKANAELYLPNVSLRGV